MGEFLRHEGITETLIFVNLRVREVPDGPTVHPPRLVPAIVTGGMETYEVCQEEARRLSNEGVLVLHAASAAMRSEAAGTGPRWVFASGRL
jgi:hypothetical protein